MVSYPNILLIVMDAVRSRNLSCYGHERETTPNLEDFVIDSVLYENAISPSYYTLPSYTSIFTGTYPSKHRVLKGGDILPSTFITLPELLKSCGYETRGFCLNPLVSSFSGLDRGFDSYTEDIAFHQLHRELRKRLTPAKGWRNDDTEKSQGEQGNPASEDTPWRKIIESDFGRRFYWFLRGYLDDGAAYLSRKALRFMIRPRDKPFFVFLHYNEAHTPYVSLRGFRERFLTGIHRKPWNVNQDYVKFLSEETIMDDEDFDILERLYDMSICYLDSQISKLCMALGNHDLLRNTLLIVTADHGESIGDHGTMGHIWNLYDELIKVPLIMRYPDNLSINGVRTEIAQTVDIFPTIADMLDCCSKKLQKQLQGNSLISDRILGRGREYGISEVIQPMSLCPPWLRSKYGEYDRGLISIRTKTRKYIYSTNGRCEYYHLDRDPEEDANRIDNQDGDLKRLRKELQPYLDNFNSCYYDVQRGGGEEPEIDGAVVERLKALGYFG